MDAGEIMRRTRYALGIDDREAQRLMRVGAATPTLEQIESWRLRPDQPGYQACPPDVLRAFLAGLVADRRGTRDAAPDTSGDTNRGSVARVEADPVATVDNNEALKSLRIALALRTEDIRDLVELGGGSIGTSELGALMRKPGTRNYRPCGDQLLRRFLKGLAIRYRPASET